MNDYPMMPPPPPDLSAHSLNMTQHSSSGSSNSMTNSGSSGSGSGSSSWGWSKIEPNLDPATGGQPAPCQRSLHVATVLNDKMYVFGGYDGSNRVNDFYECDIATRRWSLVQSSGTRDS